MKVLIIGLILSILSINSANADYKVYGQSAKPVTEIPERLTYWFFSKSENRLSTSTTRKYYTMPVNDIDSSESNQTGQFYYNRTESSCCTRSTLVSANFIPEKVFFQSRSNSFINGCTTFYLYYRLEATNESKSVYIGGKSNGKMIDFPEPEGTVVSQLGIRTNSDRSCSDDHIFGFTMYGKDA